MYRRCSTSPRAMGGMPRLDAAALAAVSGLWMQLRLVLFVTSATTDHHSERHDQIRSGWSVSGTEVKRGIPSSSSVIATPRRGSTAPDWCAAAGPRRPAAERRA
jgi:hypothetical protein